MDTQKEAGEYGVLSSCELIQARRKQNRGMKTYGWPATQTWSAPDSWVQQTLQSWVDNYSAQNGITVPDYTDFGGKEGPSRPSHPPRAIVTATSGESVNQGSHSQAVTPPSGPLN
ncbi:hypothetical protein NQZ68_025876 [Dissostichus eleginoides]|nr:hypothetical protein NQZ68_025876 [Dissostichus eleginoides]